MYLSGFPAENWQDTLPDEGGTVTDGFGMELSEHLFRKNLDFAWERKFITSEGLWLVGVSPNHKGKAEPVTIGGAKICFDELKSKDELLNFFDECGSTHAALMEFCEDYKKRYGNDLCWPYPIGDSFCLGEYLVLVREGVLSLPLQTRRADVFPTTRLTLYWNRWAELRSITVIMSGSSTTRPPLTLTVCWTKWPSVQQLSSWKMSACLS